LLAPDAAVAPERINVRKTGIQRIMLALAMLCAIGGAVVAVDLLSALSASVNTCTNCS
jgi:hypothetical protein